MKLQSSSFERMMMERDSEAVVSEAAAGNVESLGLGEAQGHATRADLYATEQDH